MPLRRNTRRKFRQKMGVTKLPKRGDTLPSAPEWFRYLREERLAKRPVLGRDSKTGEPIYGKSTFRNIINEKGELV